MNSYNLSTVFSVCTEAVEWYAMSLQSSEDNSCAHEPWLCVHGCYTQIIWARHKTAIKIYCFSEALFAVQNSPAIFWTIKQQSFSTISVRFFHIWIRVWSLIICNSFPSILKLSSLYTNLCSVHCSISINLF
jgi:hypothetical protein